LCAVLKISGSDSTARQTKAPPLTANVRT
jgi:hypothetical protein